MWCPWIQVGVLGRNASTEHTIVYCNNFVVMHMLLRPIQCGVNDSAAQRSEGASSPSQTYREPPEEGCLQASGHLETRPPPKLVLLSTCSWLPLWSCIGMHEKTTSAWEFFASPCKPYSVMVPFFTLKPSHSCTSRLLESEDTLHQQLAGGGGGGLMSSLIQDMFMNKHGLKRCTYVSTGSKFDLCTSSNAGFV